MRMGRASARRVTSVTGCHARGAACRDCRRRGRGLGRCESSARNKHEESLTCEREQPAVLLLISAALALLCHSPSESARVCVRQRNGLRGGERSFPVSSSRYGRSSHDGPDRRDKDVSPKDYISHRHLRPQLSARSDRSFSSTTTIPPPHTTHQSCLPLCAYRLH